MALRKRVYAAVTGKDMVWFDTRMGAEGGVVSAEEGQGPMGAGGLMAKFARYLFFNLISLIYMVLIMDIGKRTM